MRMTRPSSSSDVYDERFELRFRREDIEALQERIARDAADQGFGETSAFAIRLALEEALNNAFKHGNKSDPEKVVTVQYRVDREHIDILVEDQGEGFDPSTIPDPTQEENIEIPCGRGITLMRAFMSEVRFHPPGNRVQLRFAKQAGAA